jgi:acetylornithine/N-succinyldiaminopimelate aminotransferase
MTTPTPSRWGPTRRPGPVPAHAQLRRPVDHVRPRARHRAVGPRRPRYLDFVGGLAVQAPRPRPPRGGRATIAEQATKLLQVSNLWATEHAHHVAATLDRHLGGGGQVFFCNSGAEANEFAFKLARKWAGHGRYGVITTYGSFHGRTLAALPPAASPTSTSRSPRCPRASATCTRRRRALEAAIDPSGRSHPSRTRPGRGWRVAQQPRVHGRRAAPVPTSGACCSWSTRSRPGCAAPAGGSPSSTTASARRRLHGQGAGQRLPHRRGVGPHRGGVVPGRRRSRQHLRRQAARPPPWPARCSRSWNATTRRPAASLGERLPPRLSAMPRVTGVRGLGAMLAAELDGEIAKDVAAAASAAGLLVNPSRPPRCASPRRSPPATPRSTRPCPSWHDVSRSRTTNPTRTSSRSTTSPPTSSPRSSTSPSIPTRRRCWPARAWRCCSRSPRPAPATRWRWPWSARRSPGLPSVPTRSASTCARAPRTSPAPSPATTPGSAPGCSTTPSSNAWRRWSTCRRQPAVRRLAPAAGAGRRCSPSVAEFGARRPAASSTSATPTTSPGRWPSPAVARDALRWRAPAATEFGDGDLDRIRAAGRRPAEQDDRPGGHRSPAPTSSTPTSGPRWARRTRRPRTCGLRRASPSTTPCSTARPDAIFLHCLPAHRGEEVARARSSTGPAAGSGPRRPTGCTQPGVCWPSFGERS